MLPRSRSHCLAGPLAVLIGLGTVGVPAKASDKPDGRVVAANSTTLAGLERQGALQPVARSYPAPARQAYPYPSSPAPEPLRLNQPSAVPLTMDPLAVCPTDMLTFLSNSANRNLPLWVAARSCDCYAQERAQGTPQDQSSRRCFP